MCTGSRYRVLPVTSYRSTVKHRYTAMKSRLILSSCVLAVMAQSALAEQPAPPSGRSLGMMEAILSRCAQVDPKAAAQYEQRIQLIIQGAGEVVVAEVRKSDEYRQSYDSTTESLREVSEHDAREACARSLAAK